MKANDGGPADGARGGADCGGGRAHVVEKQTCARLVSVPLEMRKRVGRAGAGLRGAEIAGRKAAPRLKIPVFITAAGSRSGSRSEFTGGKKRQDLDQNSQAGNRLVLMRVRMCVRARVRACPFRAL